MSTIPAFHALYLEKQYLVAFNATQWAIGGAVYITGAIFYACKIPEKFYPKKFDIFVRK
jgi:predicted membrane channel-forming protein YqfA (hemolysin III family)